MTSAHLPQLRSLRAYWNAIERRAGDEERRIILLTHPRFGVKFLPIGRWRPMRPMDVYDRDLPYIPDPPEPQG